MNHKPDLLLGVLLGRKFFTDVDSVCHHLTQTPSFEYESLEEMRYSLLLALFEYWVFADWSGIEFFLELCRDTGDELIRCRDIPTIRRLAEANSRDYYMAHDAVKSLMRETSQLRNCYYIEEHLCDEASGAAAVRISFDVY